jgi:hypothetical protein
MWWYMLTTSVNQEVDIKKEAIHFEVSLRKKLEEPISINKPRVVDHFCNPSSSEV